MFIRPWRQGKSRVLREVAGIMDRLGTNAWFWQARIKRRMGKSRLMGSYFATSPYRLQEVPSRRSVHHVDNAVGLVPTG